MERLICDEMVAMSTAERQAFSRGISRAYAEVFPCFTEVLNSGGDIHDVLQKVSAQWDYTHDSLVVAGEL